MTSVIRDKLSEVLLGRISVMQMAKTLEEALGAIGVVMDKPCEPQIDRSTPTEIASLDVVLGGALPAGLVEIFGEESCGKTALLAHILASAQRNGFVTGLLQTEYLDQAYLADNGLDLSRVPLITGRGEGVISAVVDFLEMGQNRVLGIDSLPGVRPDSDEEAEWVPFICKLLQSAGNWLKAGSCVIAINQVRAKKSFGALGYGTESAGRRFKDIFTTRLELSRNEVSEDTYTMVARVVSHIGGGSESFIGIPARKKSGVDWRLDLVRTALAAGVISRRGAYYSMSDGEGDSGTLCIGQGERQAADNLTSELITRLRVNLGV